MTTIDNLIKSALETGLDCAQDIAHQVHEQYKGYKPHRHVAVDADVAQIKAALEALAAQPVREPLSQGAILAVFSDAETAMRRNPNLSWRYAIIDEVERAHGIGVDK